MMVLKQICKRIPVIMQLRYAQLAFRGPIKEIFRTYKGMLRYKKIYKEKRCFIVGNGPSLTSDDVDKLKGEITFAANKIYLIFPKTDWRPTFYCVQDEQVLLDMDRDALTNVTESSQNTFVRMQSYKAVKRNKLQLKKTLYLPILKSAFKRNAAPFSKHAQCFVYDGDTVTYAAMQLAAYMGFEEIYLLGVDHNFPFRMNSQGEIVVNDLSVSSHFFDGADNNRKEGVSHMRANNHDFVTASYQNAEEYSRTSGTFRIYNATKGGILEIFERVNLDEVLRKE